jgi:hypothetical protein
LYGAALQQGKNKSLASTEGARQKKSPATSDRVKCFLFAGLKKCAEKPKEKQDARKYHLCAPPYTTLKRL